jgi:hypothetical protein
VGQREPVKFTFTELLYGVVIGTAITRIGSLSLTQDTILLIVSLVLVFDDYLLYHEDVQNIEGTGRNFVLLFLLDMVVLAAWYALVLSTAYAVPVFLTCVAVFFAATSIWEWLFSQGTFLRRLFWNADLPLVLTAGALALVAQWVAWPFWVFLAAFGAIFVLWRLPTWRELWRSQWQDRRLTKR